MLEKILSSLYPQTCVACGISLWPKPKAFCQDCSSKINYIKTTFFNPNLSIHHFRSARSIALYESVWRDVIHDLKFNNKADLAGFFAGMLSSSINFEYDLIIPVPMSKKRLKEKGYNHSALLAKKLADISGFPCRFFVLERIKDVLPQVGLSQKERLLNVKGIFGVNAKEVIKGGDVLLIDDVMTTGATVNECAKVLKKGGFANVDVLTLARA